MTAAALLLAALPACAAPKYGPAQAPRAVPLAGDQGHLRKQPAADFWALIPYYEGMRSGHSASAASLAAALNALRRGRPLTAADELVTEAALLKGVTAERWAERLSGEKPEGVTLPQLAAISRAALVSHGLEGATAEVVPVTGSSAADAAKIRAVLVANEGSGRDVLIARYLQSAFTDDPEGAVGTYSPVGAFDAARDRVLILETDRKYYEPYWVSLKTFVSGLAGVPDGGLLRLAAGPR